MGRHKKNARSVPFVPIARLIYRNRGGGEFLCRRVFPSGVDAIMQNIISGWTFTAHGLRRFADGTIVWDWSSGGRFEDVA